MRNRSSAVRSAFTLVELLVVVTILGILAMLIIPRVLGNVGFAKQKTAKGNVHTLELMVQNFQAHCERLPTEQEGLRALIEAPTDVRDKWRGPYIKPKDLMDPWNVEYMYRCPGRRNMDFDIFTYGADGQEGGDGDNADVGNW